MTREEKIKNILEATEAVIKKETEEGTMTLEKYAHIIENQNTIIAMIK
jgi:hypothetical protein|nr:MAG TPA: hypothetical protein [Caudoviricetes sp.]